MTDNPNNQDNKDTQDTKDIKEDLKAERQKRKAEKKAEKLAKLNLKQSSSVKNYSNNQTKTTKKDSRVNEKEPFTPTPQGQFKHIQYLKKYNPAYVEDGWHAWWSSCNFFDPSTNKTNKNNNKNSEREVFSMVLPPPNITGKLHIGHAMMVAIQDSIVRYHSLNNREVVWVPGFDHAGIATQAVVLKNVASIIKNTNKKDIENKKESGTEFERYVLSLLETKTIQEIYNTEVLKKIAYKWSILHKADITHQLSLLGSSLDFKRSVFTMDPSVNKEVESAFIQLYRRGFIHRSHRLVNWSPQLGSTLSDLEVDSVEIDSVCVYTNKVINITNLDGVDNKESWSVQGVIYRIRYPIVAITDIDIKNIGGEMEYGDIAGEEITPSIDEDYTSIVNTLSENPDRDLYDLSTLNNSIKNNISNKNKRNRIKVEHVEIETTRPETILGDTALAFNPADSNKKYLKKYRAINPVTLRVIKIVEHDIADPEMGSGVLKITPSSDFNDFAVYSDLLESADEIDIVPVIGEDSLIDINNKNNKREERFAARRRVVNHLKRLNLLTHIKKYKQILPICSRTSRIIEPIIKDQWFMRVAETCEEIRESNLKIYPREAHATWRSWLTDTKDWCLSRQLWWGHSIPAYYVTDSNNKRDIGWIVCREEDIEQELLERYQVKDISSVSLRRDGDVLDTWFSSALWPFAVFPTTNNDSTNSNSRERYFPNSLLETGSDILFFWVARMCILSKILFNKLPFKEVLLHGIVRDRTGRKMSKSLGNVIDPVSVIKGASLKELESKLLSTLSSKEREVAISNLRGEFTDGIDESGSDALRFSLISIYSGVRDVNLDIQKVGGVRRYCNKLWNGLLCLENIFKKLMNSSNKNKNKGENSIAVEWIQAELNATIKIQHTSFGNYHLMQSTRSLHAFSYKFFDTFLELLKHSNNVCDILRGVLVYRDLVVCLSVHMPFVCEEVFQRIKLLLNTLSDTDTKEIDLEIERVKQEVSVCVAQYPAIKPVKNKEEVELFREVISKAEEMRASRSDSKSNKSTNKSIGDRESKIKVDAKYGRYVKELSILSGVRESDIDI